MLTTTSREPSEREDRTNALVNDKIATAEVAASSPLRTDRTTLSFSRWGRERQRGSETREQRKDGHDRATTRGT